MFSRSLSCPPIFICFRPGLRGSALAFDRQAADRQLLPPLVITSTQTLLTSVPVTLFPYAGLRRGRHSKATKQE